MTLCKTKPSLSTHVSKVWQTPFSLDRHLPVVAVVVLVAFGGCVVVILGSAETWQRNARDAFKKKIKVGKLIIIKIKKKYCMDQRSIIDYKSIITAFWLKVS